MILVHPCASNREGSCNHVKNVVRNIMDTALTVLLLEDHVEVQDSSHQSGRSHLVCR